LVFLLQKAIILIYFLAFTAKLSNHGQQTTKEQPSRQQKTSA
jgi:hypothetical protein